ncbi:FAD/NAD(P)-binding domain-containing protein [Xylariomycetidae sp. FL0641]|nr:FAD/NAD(P)-binding domain-containing protein [Xylariomycetidae sp. FL0641]
MATQPEEEEANRPFRVIIAGGGLVGLTAAHVLSQAGIDFVLLEQHATLTPAIGSLLSLWAPTLRVFDQLGLLGALEPILDGIDRSVMFSAADGAVLVDENPGALLRKNHGHGLKVTHRPLFVQMLYDTLPESAKARVRVQKQVTDIAVSPSGVRVTCADGSAETGSMVLGADGVHSRTRSLLSALSSDPGAYRRPYTTTYRLLFGNLAIPPAQPRGTNWEGTHAGVSTQLLTGRERAWWALYEAVPDGPSDQRRRWSEDDRQAMLARWGHLHMAPGLALRDVYAARSGPAGLISLEEGLVRAPWHWGGRVVLAGDAVRKVEPHAGLGYNSGVADVVVLANALRRLLRERARPDAAALGRLFAEYQARRAADTEAVIDMSMRRARVTAWLRWSDRFMATCVMPYLPVAKLSIQYILGPLVRRSPVLEWLDEKHRPEGEMPYEHFPLPPEERSNPRPRAVERSSGSSGVPLASGALLLAVLATTGFRYYRRIW